MRKHLLRIFFILLVFELIRYVGGELPALFRGQPAFDWFNPQTFNPFRLTAFVVFSLYSLSSFIILNFSYRKNKKRSFLYLIIAAFSIITVRYLIEEVLFLYAFGFHNYYDNVPLLYYYVDNIYFAVLYSAFGVVYFFVQNEHRRLVEHKQLQLENKQTQLSFLQSQVNPHFLFNSLNNIYSLIYQNSPHSLNAVARLSDILRYMLYDSNENIPVQKEWEYIQKYIDLQLLRFDHPVVIKKEAIGNLQTATIPPFILIPFVENAFKHGDFKQENSSLQMNLHVTDHTLRFNVSNKIGKGVKDSTGGIGLQNIKKRLELLYPGKHVLKIDDKDERFAIDLKLNYD